LHLVDVSSVSGRDSVTDYETINRELAAYDERLATRPQIVVATKLDALDEPERLDRLKARALADGKQFFGISAVTGLGVRDLVNAVTRLLDELNEREQELVNVEHAKPFGA